MWLVDAGSLATVVAYLLVAASFLVIRRQHPDLPRPYRVAAPRLVGWLAVAATVFFILLYLPGSPSALVWPEEWAIVLLWAGLGAALAAVMRRKASPDSGRQARLILGEHCESSPAETSRFGARPVIRRTTGLDHCPPEPLKPQLEPLDYILP